jgi:hypothetical protein
LFTPATKRAEPLSIAGSARLASILLGLKNKGIGGTIMKPSKQPLRGRPRTPFVPIALTLGAYAAVIGCNREPGPTENPTNPPPGPPPAASSPAPAAPAPVAPAALAETPQIDR